MSKKYDFIKITETPHGSSVKEYDVGERGEPSVIEGKFLKVKFWI